jgi:ribose-phosphate pyrophosphokinase
MLIDLTQGYGTFSTHKLFQFPDGSIKFELFVEADGSRADAVVKIRLRNHEDLFTLALVKDVLDRKYPTNRHILKIDYMMYQQDDRLFHIKESFGLKVACKFINDMNWDEVIVFAPHSDKVEFIDKVRIVDNEVFVAHALAEIPSQSEALWVIPDAGAFKSQMKMIQKMGHKDFISCSKSRSSTGTITTQVPLIDLKGQDCFIVDDICLGGATFIAIADALRVRGCGNIYLIVSHGVFNKGLTHLFDEFKHIYTTDSICDYEGSGNLKVFKI